MWIAYSVFRHGSPPACGPTQPPIVCVPTTDYLLSFSRTFPANVTKFAMSISVTAKPGKKMQALHLPFRIEVGGAAPILDYDSIALFGDSVWTYIYKVVHPWGGAANDVLFEFWTWGDAVTGTHVLATVELSMPSSATERPINVYWTAFPPVESGQPTGYPMLLDDTLAAWLPYGPGTLEGTSLLSGTVYDDADNDCSKALTEAGLGGRLIRLLPTDMATLTDDSGRYVFDSLPPGVFTLEAAPALWGAITCPPSASYTVSVGTSTTLTGLDFGNDLQPVWDLSAEVATTPARPGSELVISAMCVNLGSTPSLPADVELALPPEVGFLSSESVGSGPGIYSPGKHSVTWNLGVLAPGQSSSERLRARVLVSPSTPLGTQLCAMATVSPQAGDAAPANNVSTACRVVQNSWAANAKYVSPEGTGSAGFISRDDTLRYHVDFQNTGTDTAFDVVIRDTLDLDLDVLTVQSGVSSHPYAFSISGRELSWTFSQLKLPDSLADEPESHGFVEYTARPSEAALVGAGITNKAAIVFDSHPPVLTNEVANAICPTAPPGDVNGSGMVTSADVIYLVNCVFKSGPPPVGALGDINCNGPINSADVILLVNYVFKSGPPPCTPC
jgi:fimbrial isopeptide formation D2 family protein